MSSSGRQNLRRYYQCLGDRPSTSTAQYSDIMMPPSRSSGVNPQYVSPNSSALYSSANELQISNPPQHSSSPLSDSLLLALRRSRPNTRLFRALFQYMPIRDSPNENPHLELPLQAGDYVLVHGQMDEDQFYFGETLNGRTGLVPSNYVERVPDHVLLQNASRAPSPVTGLSGSLTNISCCEASTSNATCAGANRSNATVQAGNTIQPGFLAAGDKLMSSCHEMLNSSGCGGISGSISGTLPRVGSPSFVLHVPPHHARMVHDFTDPELAPLPDSVCPYPPVDVSKVTVQEVKQPDQPRVPFPREITIEKKLSRSAVISWLPPEDKLIAVSQYHVCADGVVKAVVPGTYKCKALIEDLNLDKCVNISVRAVTEHGHSPDAACTIAIGTEAPVAPQHVRVSSITPISACLSWYPSNANAEHVVLLNAIKVGVCPSSVFQLQGLSPSTIYRVSVRTKHPKAVLEQRPVERCVDFKTLPKIGLPNPPAHVQVEVGPQPGTLLISWKPVSSQPRPPSRAAVHSYLVFADGRNIAQVPSATADHVLLRLADFADDPPIFITVRTRTREGAISADSNVVRVPRGISAANPNVLASGDHHLPFSSSIAVNTATAPPLATASMPNSLIGGVIGSQQPQHYDVVQSAMNTIAMPYSMAPNSAISVGSAPSGLLTTLPQQSQPLQQPAPQPAGSLPLHHTTVHGQQHQMYNTAYPLNQAAIFPSSQNAANAALYCATAGPVSGGLLNGSANAAKLVDWKQQQQSAVAAAAVAAHQQQQQRSQVQQAGQSSSQYYTFHPKSLFKEFTGVDEKPSVLEMENNYLLKHRQQQRDRELGSLERWPGQTSTLNRYDYYGTTRSNGRYDDMTRALPSTRPMMMQGGRKPTAIPPRLARVRSEEILGTRSEPDLRPLAIADDEENCRWFVALFDYDHMMSPNPNAQQEELSFRRHQLIKVYGEVDQDGFYRGQIGRRFGLVPSNMVIEIAKDDLMPQRRRSDAYPVEPAIRRMRWGSLKSRSYDHAGDRHRRGIIPGASYTPSQAHMVGPSVLPGAPMYSSLDRREQSLPPYSRYYDRPGYEHQQPASARSYGRSYGNNYGYTGASRDYPQRDHHYDDRTATLPPVSSEMYDRGLPRDYRDRRVGVGAPPPGDDYGRDAYPAPMWGEYGGETREPRDARGDYRYDHPPASTGYEDERYQPPPQQQPRTALRRDYQRYSAEAAPAPGQWNQPVEQDQYGMAAPSGGPGSMLPQQPTGQYPPGRYPPSQQQQQQPPAEDRFVNINGEPTQVQKAVAKYDYDPKICSPNVDAEQVELTFHQGDVILIYGERDDDGFYVGELNGKRGMVPYNFLQIPGQPLIAPPPNAGQPQSIMAGNAAAVDAMPATVRPKGVAFSETAAKKPPARQTSQTSNKVGSTTSAASAGTGSAGAKAKAAGAAGGAAKTLTKKASDLGTKGAAASVARKSSQAAKKADGKKK